MESKKLIRVREAAQLLGRGESTIYLDVKNGNVFPVGVYVKIGKLVYFNRERLLEWIAQGGNAATEQAASAA